VSVSPPSDTSMRARPPADHLDELIAAAARSMTEAQPSPRLRTEIRLRVQGPGDGLSLTRWRPAAAIAALVIVVGVAAVVRFLPYAPDGVRTTEISRGDIALPSFVGRSAKERTPIEPGIKGPSVMAQRSTTGARAANAIPTAFQIAPADEPTPPPFPALVVDRLAIEPLPADPVPLDDVTGPVPLQVQRIEISALSLDEDFQ
jgi:hypothetical protein